MEQAGFNRVNVHPASLDTRIHSPADFSRGLVFGNPLHDEVVSRGGDPETVRDAIETVIRNEIGSEISLGIVIAEGNK